MELQAHYFIILYVCIRSGWASLPNPGGLSQRTADPEGKPDPWGNADIQGQRWGPGAGAGDPAQTFPKQHLAWVQHTYLYMHDTLVWFGLILASGLFRWIDNLTCYMLGSSSSMGVLVLCAAWLSVGWHLSSFWNISERKQLTCWWLRFSYILRPSLYQGNMALWFIYLFTVVLYTCIVTPHLFQFSSGGVPSLPSFDFHIWLEKQSPDS